jgi:2-oxo-3-hexenedioate decarboxylase/2-keto-4-pentenoate hydratase
VSAGAAAAFFAGARLARTRMGGLPPELRPADIAAAYRVQDALHVALSGAGLGALAGHKIGCTTRVMQQYLKVDHPCAGGVFAGRVYRDAARLRHGAFVRVGVECEIAVLLGRDLPARDRLYAAAEVAPAIAACAAAIEIVDDRWIDYRTVDTPTLVADDFFSAACVLGGPRRFDPSLELPALRGTMSVGGREVGRGTGADALGSPLNALAWLASARGGLKAGEFVLTGSIVQTHWAARGEACAVEVEGLGAARVTFE